MAFVFIILVLITGYIILFQIYKWISLCRRFSLSSFPLSTLIILGSGGHTTEMIKILSKLSLSHYAPRFYVVANSDSLSVQRLFQHVQDLRGFDMIPRAREVGQGFSSSLLSGILALLIGITILLRHRPKIIICNGPGTCVPICFAALILRNTLLPYIYVVYIESICRVDTLSLTGRILINFADFFLVQWNELVSKYPYIKCIGRIM
eukprot:TRINITY_DN721_c0_g1_i1.p1 TRINITY_DN721_c0_g1~~TRINITY_DN721_c0_g1_i1.p1  ORF type:complete len:216 (+),score=-14.36 TRINITY_DN721_c0_g1_i1:29-649(+)